MPTPITPSRKQLVDAAIRVLANDDRVIFAYLYGSMVSKGEGNDVDIAIFQKSQADSYALSADLKIGLHKETDLPPDTFDVRILNEIIEKGDIFAILYLKNVLENGQILVNKSSAVRADFLERYGFKFRECEGLMQEVLA